MSRELVGQDSVCMQTTAIFGTLFDCDLCDCDVALAFTAKASEGCDADFYRQMALVNKGRT
jgi:hypothetical protein